MNSEHYRQHLKTLCQRYDLALQDSGFDQVILSAGNKVIIAGDDHAYPYAPRAFTQQWLPYGCDAGTCVLYRPNEKPILFWPSRADFWHLTPEAPTGDWADLWDIRAAGDLQDWVRDAIRGRKTAWIGADEGLSEFEVQVDPTDLKNRLSYRRAWKTDFEIDCMAEASRLGVAGHLAAKAAFLNGESEAGIYRAFLWASGQLESTEPYPGIIALNASAATLHYERRLFDPPREHRTLLIDAGAKYNGYASDITRTHTHSTGTFAELRTGVEALSDRLSRAVQPGVAMADLHRQAVAGVAHLLKDHGLCRWSVEEQLEKRIPQVFFPHGLGHLLGLQVHDVGGHQQDETGTLLRDEDFPNLRLTRTLSEGMTLTIEPGLYFIPMLLAQMEREIPDHGVDMDKVEALKPWGGIRHEDNILVTASGSRNLTEEAFTFTHEPG